VREVRLQPHRATRTSCDRQPPFSARYAVRALTPTLPLTGEGEALLRATVVSDRLGGSLTRDRYSVAFAQQALLKARRRGTMPLGRSRRG
jgi:hypothetical protein